MIGLFRDGLADGDGVLPALRLDGDQVYLRPPRPRDWREWVAVREASRAFLEPWEPRWPDDALSKAAFLRRYKRQVRDWRTDQGYAFLIFAGADDRMVGGITMANLRRGVAQTCTIGYWTALADARRGFMSEAVILVLDFGFRMADLHRIEAACLPRNHASKGLLEKLGFTLEGRVREYLKINGVWEDHLLYSFLRRDYNQWTREDAEERRREEHGLQDRLVALPAGPTLGPGPTSGHGTGTVPDAPNAGFGMPHLRHKI